MGYKKVDGNWIKVHQHDEERVEPVHAREPTPPAPSTFIRERHDRGHVIQISETQVEGGSKKYLKWSFLQ